MPWSWASGWGAGTSIEKRPPKAVKHNQKKNKQARASRRNNRRR